MMLKYTKKKEVLKMSEQTIQNKLYSNNVQIMDKYECLSLGATTIKNLIDSKILKKVNISSKNLNKKPMF